MARAERTAHWPPEAADPHELAEFAWSAGDEPTGARLALAQALYRDMPCYAVLMYGTAACKELRDPERTIFWDEVRAVLSSADDGLAEPMGYWLVHDWFDSSRDGKDAWREVTRLDEPYERRVERVLIEASWSTPWDLKVELYQRLLGDRRWHYPIFRSLLDSAESVAGDIDRKDGQRILAQLALEPATPDVDKLESSLRDGWTWRQRPRRRA